MSSKKSSGKTAPKRGVDALLNIMGKSLPIGQEVRLTLVKGPSHSDNKAQADPVNPNAPPEMFPLVARFPESVMRPNFEKLPWKKSRLYQQDVPKAQEDSDDEDAAAAAAAAAVKKRWKSKRKEVPKRQWVLQEQVDFLQTMMTKRQKKNPQQQTATNKDAISTRYEGIAEFNASQYILLEESAMTTNEEDQESPVIQVTVLPSQNATIQFSQPAARKTLSMSQAEQAIEDQRGKTTRFFMQQTQRLGANGAGSTNRVPTTNVAALTASGGSRSRLFGKMTKMDKAQAARNGAGDGEGGGGGATGGATGGGGGGGGGNDDDDDDIMGDLAYRNRKGSGKKARKELLDTLGDSGIKVDPEGVLGGANDSEFGRGMKFGRFQNSAKGANGKNEDEKEGANNAGSSKGNDGQAMADDFYQRDVQAEYEELDFDANEQFDDDDVDLGESEMMVDTGGFGGDDEEDEDDDEDEDMDNGAVGGAEGLASFAGFKMLLAKARGEITSEQIAEAQQQQAEVAKKRAERERQNGNKNHDDSAPDHLTQIMEAAESSGRNKEDGQNDQDQQDGQVPVTPGDTGGIQVDSSGQRIINQSTVRREIWLNHGRMPMRRLMKIFDVKKKSAPERRNMFLAVVKELCTIVTDPISGRTLVLKQHYSSMR